MRIVAHDELSLTLILCEKKEARFSTALWHKHKLLKVVKLFEKKKNKKITLEMFSAGNVKFYFKKAFKPHYYLPNVQRIWPNYSHTYNLNR